MQIQPVKTNLYNNYVQNKTRINPRTYSQSGVMGARASYPSCYYLSFGARVDKGIKRFYAQNKEYMPLTVKEYIENSSFDQTPLEAQREAYSLLEICRTVDEIKEAYPDEPLFADLKSANSTKATRGFLYDYRIMEDCFEEDETPLKTGEDLTVYLVKKAFLEAKTLDEINEELDRDINPVFKRESKDYVRSSTLHSLGIKLPKNEYLTSLRYTREGYSDGAADKQRKIWDLLSDDKKEERLKILRQNAGQGNRGVSDETRTKLSQTMKDRWANMSPEEKTAQIEKLQTGGADGRICMINAWNGLFDIREKLSEYLTENNFHNPANIIYRNMSYSEGMRKIMTDFWAQNPDFGERMGEAIANSHTQLKAAKENGNYDELEESILEKQKEIKARMKAARPDKQRKKGNAVQAGKHFEPASKKPVSNNPAGGIKTDVPEISPAFAKFKKVYGDLFSFLPEAYLNDYFAEAAAMEDGELEYYAAKYLNNEAEVLKPSKNFQPSEEMKKKERAMEFALVETLCDSMSKEYRQIYMENMFVGLRFRELTSIYRHAKTIEPDVSLSCNGVNYFLHFDKELDNNKLSGRYAELSAPLTESDKTYVKNKLLRGSNKKEEYEPKLTEALEGQNKTLLRAFKPGEPLLAKVKALEPVMEGIPADGKYMKALNAEYMARGKRRRQE